MVQRATLERRALARVRRYARRAAEARIELGKRPSRRPHAVLDRIDVDEEAQHTVAVGRPVGAGVDVHELVARVRGKVAALLLDGTEAGGAGRPAARERWHGAREKSFDAGGMLLQYPLRPLGDGGVRLQPRHAVGFRVVADVLVAQVRRQVPAQEPEIGLVGKLDRAAWEVNDLAALEGIAQRVGGEPAELFGAVAG